MGERPSKAPMDNTSDFYEWWAARWLCYTIKFGILWVMSIIAFTLLYAGHLQSAAITVFASMVVAEVAFAILWRRM